MRRSFQSQHLAKRFPCNRPAVRLTRPGHRARSEDPLQPLCRALKAAARSRDRLIRLAPDIFAVEADAASAGEENKAWWSEYVDVVYRILDDKEGLPPKAPP